MSNKGKCISKPEKALNELKGVGNEVFRYDTEK